MKLLSVCLLISFLLGSYHAQVINPVSIDTQNKGNDVVSYDNLVVLDEILDIFNIRNVASNWSNIYKSITANCSNDMAQYFRGLQNSKFWAMKMDDSSGKYNKGFFWGNNYWTGSITQCSFIYRSSVDKYQTKTAKTTDISYINGNFLGASEIMHENPPFVPGFYMLKVLLNDTLMLGPPRTILMGLCLPGSCQLDDITKMTSSSSPSPDNFRILGVRSPTLNNFSLWKDFTFQVLFVVTIVVSLLLIGGTGYDLVLRKRQKEEIKIKSFSKDLSSESSSGLGCTTYDLTQGIHDKGGKPRCDAFGITVSVNNNNSDENLAIEPAVTGEQKLSVWAELLLSFSVVTNIRAICDRNVGNDTIPSIHGLRALSMLWVILGHTMIVVFKYSDNMELRKVVEKEVLFQAILNGAYSVDTFFFISGFLVSYIYFRTNAKGKLEKLTQGVNDFTAGTYHFFGLVGYRFVRLTAPYLYVLGMVEVIMRYLEQNSVFEPPTKDHITCPKYWWRNIMYINTLFPVEQMCMLWSWYLADDTQFYIIGAIILIIAVRHFKFAAGMLLLFMISSWATTAYIAFSNNHMPNADDPFALFDKIYDKPWTRLGPYLVGMCVGWILFKTNCKIRLSWIAVITGWTVSTSMILYLLFGLFNTTLTQITAAAYSSLSHTAWAMACAWIIIACSTGYGGWINKLLSAPLLYPFSRVTYCAYLVHPIVNRIYAMESESPIHMSPNSLTTLYMGQVVSSYLLAFVISLSFEAPVVTMLRIMSPNKKR
ncbi:O-acyltransferase like protein-like [Toxorhynchites rutilus septentrionalis]|uniref:O-acyltransferase like protein-like n=1 Tax=Toxorhynchites rutilus septentrionalis TaxID=329112 RepID=UPI002479469C|nr:O-acyltransferase like protein-like [Toxorhynchites rutilus septentrionalis]